MGARPTTEVFIICQPQEVPFSLGWDEIPRLYRLPSGHLNEKKINQGLMIGLNLSQYVIYKFF